MPSGTAAPTNRHREPAARHRQRPQTPSTPGPVPPTTQADFCAFSRSSATCCNVCVVPNGVMSVNQLSLLSGSHFVFGVWRSNWFLLLVVCTEVVSGTRGSCLRTASSPSPERTGSREEAGTGQVALRGHSSVKPMSFKEGSQRLR